MRGNPTKTVAVIRFEATDGRPIAVYCNYAVHAVLNGQLPPDIVAKIRDAGGCALGQVQTVNQLSRTADVEIK
jgi:hypothetical protein